MNKLLIKYVLVLNNSDTWLQMTNHIDELDMLTPNTHLERWIYARNKEGDHLCTKRILGGIK